MKEFKALHSRAELTKSILNVAVTKTPGKVSALLNFSQQDGQFEEPLVQSPELLLLGSGPMWRENVPLMVSVHFLPDNEENKTRFCFLLIIISSSELENSVYGCDLPQREVSQELGSVGLWTVKGDRETPRNGWTSERPCRAGYPDTRTSEETRPFLIDMDEATASTH